MIVAFFGHSDFCEQKDYYDELFDLISFLKEEESKYESVL